MIRTCSLAALVICIGLTALGCNNRPAPPPDAPIKATQVEPGKKPKTKVLEAAIEEPKK
jgi:hypothetical protein